MAQWRLPRPRGGASVAGEEWKSRRIGPKIEFAGVVPWMSGPGKIGWSGNGERSKKLQLSGNGLGEKRAESLTHCPHCQQLTDLITVTHYAICTL